MYEVKILNEQKKIAYLKWKGVVKASEVSSSNQELKNVYKKFGEKKFYLIVDVSELKVFAPETKELIIEQQKYFVPKLYKVAEVVGSILTTQQMKETKEKAENKVTENYRTIDDALKHLVSISIY